MNYRKEYNNLIEKRQLEILEKTDELYTEVHHIIPSSFGGSNKKENLVRLTGEEHYLAHYYLYESYDKGTEDRFTAMACYMAMTVKSNTQSRSYLVDAKIYQQIREEYQEVLEKRGLEKVKEIISFIEINKRNPREDNSEEYERNLAYKLVHLRQAKKGNETSHVFFESYQNLAEKHNLNDLFETRDYEKESKDKVIEICEWIKDNDGVYPKGLTSAKSEIEKQFAKKISRLKQIKNGNESGFWSDELQGVVESYGYNDLFLSLDELLTVKLETLKVYIETNGFPKQKGNKESRTLWNLLSSTRLKKSKGKLNEINEKLIEDIEELK